MVTTYVAGIESPFAAFTPFTLVSFPSFLLTSFAPFAFFAFPFACGGIKAVLPQVWFVLSDKGPRLVAAFVSAYGKRVVLELFPADGRSSRRNGAARAEEACIFAGGALEGRSGLFVASS